MRENRFYVYVYLDPRKPGKYIYENYSFKYEPFYVGEGHGKRAYKHLGKNAKTNKENKLLICAINQEINRNPEIVFIQSGLTEYEAKKIEIKYITSIGRKDLKKGPLTNKTNGGDGTSGLIMTKKHLDILKNIHSKPIIQYDLCGNMMKEWKNIISASRFIGIDSSTISCALLKRSKTAGGFIWFYKSNFKNNKTPKNLRPEIVNKLTTFENNQYKKRVVQFLIDGKFVRIFNSIEDAAKNIRISRSSISKVCVDKNKNHNKTAGGFTWFFENDFIGCSIPKRLSDDLIKKITAQKNALNNKKIIQLSNDGILIAKWDSIKAASRTLKIPHSTISTACSGKFRHNRAVGFIWKYDNNKDGY